MRQTLGEKANPRSGFLSVSQGSLNSFLPKSDNLSMVRAQWAEKFNISDADISEWKGQMTPGEDPLHWGLTHGKLSEPLYLKWAMEAFAIPLVTNDFFAIPADQMFWDRIKDLHAWRPDFIPLAEWEGVLLIACLQPPEEFRFRQEHRFVLASAGNLQMLWRAFNPHDAAAHTAAPAPTENVPRQTPSVSEATLTGTNHDLGPQAEAQVQTQPALKPQEEAPEGLAGLSHSAPATESPEGLSFDFGSEAHEQASATSESEGSEAASAPDAESALDMPVGFSEVSTSGINLDFSTLDSGSISSSTSTATPTEPIAATQAKPAAAAAAPSPFAEPPAESQSAITQTEPIPVPELKPASHVATPPPPQPFGPKTEPVAQAKAKTSGSADTVTPSQPSPGVLRELEAVRAATAASPHLNHEPRGQESLVDFSTQVANSPNKTPSAIVEEAPLDACRNYDDLAAQVLLRVQKTFEQGMILLFQGGELRPWKWGDSVSSASGNKPAPIPLEDPSIFRIVFRTCLPYHGFVVPNPINTRFFAEFCKAQVPAHVTITPIMIDNQIGGMLMGMMNGRIDYKSSLKQMERLNADVGQHLKRLRGNKAA